MPTRTDSVAGRVVWSGLWLLLVLLPASLAHAQNYKTKIQATQRGAIASGSNARVAMVEAPVKSADGKYSPYNYAPNTSDPDFRTVTFHVDNRARTSKHSTTVAKLLFGSRRSVTNGIGEAWVFPMPAWSSRLVAWSLDADDVDELFPAPVMNHSWVASSSAARNARVLKRLDYSAISNNVLHVYGVRRRGAGEPLLAAAFNGISVGGAAMNIDQAYPVVDELYAGERYRPEIVAPFAYSSAAVAVVSAAALRLNALAATRDINIDVAARGGSSTLPAELLKALLLAGATPDFVFKNKKEILQYRFGRGGLAANGLDKRYGMGMLNVAASEQILTSKKPMTGFVFAGQPDSSAANGVAAYPLMPSHDGQLTVSLVWLLPLQPGVGNKLDGQLLNLDLCVVETSDTVQVIRESVGTTDTTENLHVALKRGKQYELRVLYDQAAQAPWPYALAWRFVRAK